ncbi:MAG: caspase family protein, partial [Chitinophagaceae bacterium]
MINLEIEIVSPESKEHIYALRNYLAENMDNLQISMKEQAPVEGQMSVFSVEGLLNGVIHAGVGIGIEQCIHILWPLISDWLKKMKSGDGKKIEVLATLGDNSGRVTFSEDTDGVTKRYENVTYSIDTAHTRVILIGSGEFENDFLPIPPVKGNVEDLYRILVDKRNIGIPPENITVALNKTNTEVEELLLRVSKLPDTETLLIYFSGHGYRSDVDKLHLIARNTRKVEDHILSGIDYDFIKKVILKTSPAKQKIVILDACHSGIATQGGQDSIMEINVTGTYVLASSESDEVSYFDKNKRNTFFTGALLDILRNGIDNAREMLALNDLYENSKNYLDQKQQPRYKDKLNISPADFFVARNPSFSIDKNIQHAFALYNAGNLADALRECRRILKRWPDNAEIKNLAEQCNNDQLFIRFAKEGDEFFYQSHQYKKALESYEQAYEIKPDFAIGEKIRSCKEFLHAGDQAMSSSIISPAPIKKNESKKEVKQGHEESGREEKKHGIPQKFLALIIAAAVIGIGSLIML